MSDKDDLPEDFTYTYDMLKNMTHWLLDNRKFVLSTQNNFFFFFNSLNLYKFIYFEILHI